MGFAYLPVGYMDVNAYIIWDDSSLEACVIDPGADGEKIAAFLDEKSLILREILLTHAHGDHIGGVKPLMEKYKPVLRVHEADAGMLSDSEANYSKALGMGTLFFTADQTMKDHEVIQIGRIQIQVLHTPGHTKGGACFYLKSEDKLISGDTLFRGSIGRTDFAGGNYDEIIESIQKKLFTLPDQTLVLPGHGPSSTIEYEKRHNPFAKVL